MSLSKVLPRTIATSVLFSAVVLLGACGFRPLYGQNGATSTADQQTVAALAAIEVGNIANREGQMMRTALQRRLAVRPSGAPAQYKLHVSLKESVQELAVQRNSFATRANLSLTATFRLVRIIDGRELASGTPRSVASYNILASQYSTLAAKTDARHRAIDALADDISARLAVYFAGPGAQASSTRGGPAQP